MSLSRLLHPGARWTFVAGKGGVGKTTTAAALAVSLADEGDRVLVLSTDPAHSLGDALGVTLGPDPAPVPGVEGLEAMEVDAATERARFLGTRRGALLKIIERGTYLERSDAEEMVDLAVPGMDELAALLRLIELAADDGRRLVIDTAPTGHTLRLLDLPATARGWVAALEAMDEKHRVVAEALTRGGFAGDDAGALVGELEAELDAFTSMLRDERRTRFALVTNPGPVVLAETRRYQAQLEERGIALAGIVVNRSGAGVPEAATGTGMVFVPPLPFDPRGAEGLRRFAAAAVQRPGGSAPGEELTGQEPAAPRVGGAALPPLDRRLYLVGGKGGVGKSTAAAALAVALAGRRAGRVLLLGIDPAGSLADVLGCDVGPEAAAVPAVERLEARQLDAARVWADFQREYREQAGELFAALLSGGLSATADQRVVERLIDLAPPGIDELVALLEVVDLNEDRPYDALVVDTAPTGHLIRLLEMPDVALQWTRMLLRLLLKYREVVGLGDLAERVLGLSRRLKTLRGQLGDPEHTLLLVVALPESLSVPETARLIGRLGGLEVPAGALLVNRLLEGDRVRSGAAGPAGSLLHAARAIPAFAAPDLPAGPVGADALSEYLDGWRELSAAPAAADE